MKLFRNKDIKYKQTTLIQANHTERYNKACLPQVLIVELSDAAPVERPPLETAETTEDVEDAGDDVAVVEEAAVVDVNRSPDSISARQRDPLIFAVTGSFKGLSKAYSLLQYTFLDNRFEITATAPKLTVLP